MPQHKSSRPDTRRSSHRDRNRSVTAPSDGDITHPSNYPAPTQTTSSAPESTILPDSQNGSVGNWEASLGSDIPQYWSNMDSMGFDRPAPADWPPTPWGYSLRPVPGQQQGEYANPGPEGDTASVIVNPNDSPRSPVSPRRFTNHRNEFLPVKDAVAHVWGGQGTDYTHGSTPSIGSASYMYPEQDTPTVSVQHLQQPIITELHGTDDGLGHQATQHGYNVGLGIHHIGIPQQYAVNWSQPESQLAYPYFSHAAHDVHVDVGDDDPEQETQASAQSGDGSGWTSAAYSLSDDCDEGAEGWHLINKE